MPNKKIPCLDLKEFVQLITNEPYKDEDLLFPLGMNGYYSGELDILRNGFEKLPLTYVQNYYKIFLLKKGNIAKIIQTQQVEVKEQELYISKPGQMKRWWSVNEPNGYLVAFSKGFLHSLDEKNNIYSRFPYLSPVDNAHFKVNKEQYQTLYDLVSGIHREFKRRDPLSYELICVRTVELLLMLKRYSRFEKEGQAHVTQSALISQRFIDCVEEHFIQGIRNGFVPSKGVAEFAQDLFVHPGHLNDSLKKYLGKTAKSILNERFLTAAKCNLIHSRLTIAEISYLLGFETPSYFNRFFKKFTGQTPLEYRDKNSIVN